EDHCAGTDLCIRKGQAGETYNLGGKNEQTNIDIVRLLCRLLDAEFAADTTLAARFPDSPAAGGRSSDELITFVADRPGHDRRYAIDTTRAERELGYRPAETFASGILRTVRWYLDHEEWWRAVMDGRYREWLTVNYQS